MPAFAFRTRISLRHYKKFTTADIATEGKPFPKLSRQACPEVTPTNGLGWASPSILEHGMDSNEHV